MFNDRPKKPAFFCVPVSTDLTDPIFDKCQQRFELANKYGTHVTLLFKPKGVNKMDLMARMGKEVVLTPLYILGRAAQGCTVVFSIDCPDLYREGSRPHVTIGTGAGYPPNVSNHIIEDWLSGNNEDVTYIETDMPPIKGVVSAAIYGKQGLAYVDQKDWVR